MPILFNSCSQDITNKEYENIGLFLAIILNGRISRPSRKERKRANLSYVEEATSKDEVKIEKCLQEQKSKNIQYKTKSDLNAWNKFCESLQGFRAIEDIPANELDLFKFFKMALSMSRVLEAASSEVFNASCMKKKV